MSPEKAILISIQPQHVLNILNGRKTLEIRKTVPKGFKGWVYIYCTKRKPLLTYDVFDWDSGWVLYDSEEEFYCDKAFHVNGQVVARFWFDEYKTLEYHKKNEVLMWDNNYYYYTEEENTYCSVQWILDELCLEHQQVLDYGKEKDLYAWHIKKLEVFDKPMMLSEFYGDFVYIDTDEHGRQHNPIHLPIPVKRPPQSWQYAYILGAKQ